MSELTNMAAAHFDATTMMRYDANKRSTGITYLLWFFLGFLGVHRFYLRHTGSAIAMLCLGVAAVLLTVVGGGVAAAGTEGAAGAGGMLAILGFVAYGIVGVWWIVDAFLIPGMTRTYNNGLITQLSGPGAAAVLR